MTDATNAQTTTNETATAAPRFVPKIKGHVTLPLLKIAVNTNYFVRFTGDIHLGKEISGNAMVDPNTGEVKSKKEPAYIAFVDNLETEEPVQIIVSTVMRKELMEQYPNDDYVGKCFMFSLNKPAGKSYNVPQIAEIEDPNSEKGTAARAKFDAKRKAATAQADGGEPAQANDAAKAPAKKK